MPRPCLLSWPALRDPHGPPRAYHELARLEQLVGSPVPPRQRADAAWALLLLAPQRRVWLLPLVCSRAVDPPLRAHESALDVDLAQRWRQWW
ncbi:MAG TPA: hypothetical protein VFB50_08800 [Chloroflexota bacterium]|nr:hypothetical protein [Chloroflexota bacterium]